jgi:two-component system, chemotaxis family, CheB/CheR fusion protein
MADPSSPASDAVASKDPSPTGPRSESLPVVVAIGASAGGLQPLQQFFENVPESPGCAFVVVQHLSPDFKSLMKELLSRHTNLPVFRVEQDMPLKADAVFLIPPGKNLSISDGKLKLHDPDANKTQRVNFPIDIFLESLAFECGDRAVAVILSGTGSDGTRGIRELSESGGLVLAQDPDTCQFDGMPRSAIGTGLVHHILPPDKLAKAAAAFARTPRQSAAADSGMVLDENALARIAALLRADDGIDFTHYKAATLLRRVARRMAIGGFETVEGYLAELTRSAQHRAALRSDLLISVTAFFRDPAVWAALEHEVIPQIVREADIEQPIRCWVTACATGEEVYSLAILMKEEIARSGKNLELKIFATDIDRLALERASAGVYGDHILADVGEARIRRYFIPSPKGYQVAPELREAVIFARHNLTKDAPFTRMDLVSCRNVLIYLQPELQHRVLANLHFSLRTGGTLVLGTAETPGDLDEEFDGEIKKHKIYNKRRDVILPLHHRNDRMASLDFIPRRTPVGFGRQLSTEPLLIDAFKQFLAERQAACLIVSPQGDLLHVFGDGSPYLNVPQGQLTSQLSRMLSRAMAGPVATAMHRAEKERKLITFTDVPVDEVGDSVVSLGVTFQTLGKAGPDYFIIRIQSQAKSLLAGGEAAETTSVAAASNERFAELERELQQVKENLQATIEELQTTNEEQQATNEELMAANEELQSTNEELQSTNEELYTVNTEYQSKIQELSELNTDIDNLLRSTDIGTLFLDRNLLIRKFTPAARDVVKVREGDIGRPIDDISTTISGVALAELARDVIATSKPSAREASTASGARLLIRTHPFVTHHGKSEGAVITFVDISQLSRAQTELRESREFLAATIDALPAHVCIVDDRGMIAMVNAAWRRFGENNGLTDPRFCVGASYLEACSKAAGVEAYTSTPVADAIRRLLAGSNEEFALEYPCFSPTEHRWFELRATGFTSQGRRWALVKHSDVSNRKITDARLRDAMGRIREALRDHSDLPPSVKMLLQDTVNEGDRE